MLENVRDYEEKVFFIYLDKHVSCPCLHDRNISKNVFFFLRCANTFSFDMVSK